MAWLQRRITVQPTQFRDALARASQPAYHTMEYTWLTRCQTYSGRARTLTPSTWADGEAQYYVDGALSSDAHDLPELTWEGGIRFPPSKALTTLGTAPRYTEGVCSEV